MKRPGIYIALLYSAAALAGCAGPRSLEGESPVEASYYAEENRTSYKLRESIVLKRDRLLSINRIGEPIFFSVSAFAACRGQEGCIPQDAALSFASFSNDGLLFIDNHDLHLLVDGEPITFNAALHNGGEMHAGTASEVVIVPLTIAQIIKIGRATTVTGTLGSYGFSMQARHLESIRTLADMLAQMYRIH